MGFVRKYPSFCWDVLISVCDSLCDCLFTQLLIIHTYMHARRPCKRILTQCTSLPNTYLMGCEYRKYWRIFFGERKGTSQKHLDLYVHHISYQLKEKCFGPSLTQNNVGFNQTSRHHSSTL